MYIKLPKFLNDSIEINSSSEDTNIMRHAKWILKEIHKMTNDYSISEDLFQQGMLGLMKAKEKFNESKKVKFLSYARFWIRKYIKEYLDKQNEVVKIPGSFKFKMYMIWKHQQKNPNLSVEDICKKLRYSKKDTKELKEKYKLTINSLDEPKFKNESDSPSLSAFIINEDDYKSKIEYGDLIESMSNIINQQYGRDEAKMFVDYFINKKTLKELSDEYNCSHVTIRNKINSIRDTLKNEMKKEISLH